MLRHDIIGPRHVPPTGYGSRQMVGCQEVGVRAVSDTALVHRRAYDIGGTFVGRAGGCSGEVSGQTHRALLLSGGQAEGCLVSPEILGACRRRV